jgi:hypothetical protein
MLEHATTVFEDVLANSDEFNQAVRRAGYESPTAAAGITDSRFRLFLKVPGKPELTGVYYVSGWRDEGVVHLTWDDEDQEHIIPRRREAIMATRAKG